MFGAQRAVPVRAGGNERVFYELGDPLGTQGLGSRLRRFIDTDNGQGGQRGHRQGGCQYREPVAGYKLTGGIPGGVRPRVNRAALAKTLQIFLHLPYGSVAMGRLALEHLENNGGQISLDLAPQTLPARRPLRCGVLGNCLCRRARCAPMQHAIHPVDGRLWIAKRPSARQHFVEDHPQGKNIAEGVHQFAAKLLRTRIARSEQSELSYLSTGIAQHFGGAKIEQLHRAVRGHQDVRGFQIAVNNQVPVRKLHGLAHLKKQPDAPLHGQFEFGAVPIEELALDVVHREVKVAIRGHAAIQQAGDVGMGEGGRPGAEPSL